MGLNYTDHAAETGSEVPDRPKLFLKAPNTITAHERTITLKDPNKRYDAEAELGVVIDRQARDVTADEAGSYLRGFTCFNDFSNRTDQRQEQNWVRGKSFDGAAAIGPVLSSPDEVPDDAQITGLVNGDVRQEAHRSDMLFSVKELIEEISGFMTLEAGDVIATGTPAGVEPLEDGDLAEVEIEGIGTLRNRIRFQQD